MKWIIPLLSLALAGMLLMAAHQSLAADEAIVKCQYKDISFTGKTQYEARKKVADVCMDKYMAFNDARMGNFPDEIQTDLLVQECVNGTSCR